MRKNKIYWLVTAFVFIWGIITGIIGYIFLGPALGHITYPTEKENAAKVENQYTLPDSDVFDQDAGIGMRGAEDNEEQPDSQDSSGNKSDEGSISPAEKEKIIADYKQALGILFDAWKAKDMPTFRTMIANAYTGDLLEKHIERAQKFIPRGIGLYVTEVAFDEVKVESADKSSATVNAIYRYTVRDFDLDEQYPVGEEFQHFVHVRANLVKINSRWFITGETVI